MADFIKMTGLYENKDKNGNLYYRGTAQDGKTYWVTLNRNKKGDKYPDAELAYTDSDPNYKSVSGVLCGYFVKGCRCHDSRDWVRIF